MARRYPASHPLMQGCTLPARDFSDGRTWQAHQRGTEARPPPTLGSNFTTLTRTVEGHLVVSVRAMRFRPLFVLPGR